MFLLGLLSIVVSVYLRSAEYYSAATVINAQRDLGLMMPNFCGTHNACGERVFGRASAGLLQQFLKRGFEQLDAVALQAVADLFHIDT